MGLSQKTGLLGASGEHGQGAVYTDAQTHLFPAMVERISVSASDVQKCLDFFPAKVSFEKRKALTDKKRGDWMVPLAPMGVVFPVRFLIRITDVKNGRSPSRSGRGVARFESVVVPAGGFDCTDRKGSGGL